MGTVVFLDPTLYPKSEEFIQEMSPERVQRLHRCGWSLEPLIFFEGSFNAISGVCAGIVRNYSHEVYWQTFYATDGTIDSLSDTELKCVIEHEQSEVYASLNDVNHSIGITTLEAESERHIPEFEELRRKYGLTVDLAIRKIAGAAERHPKMSRFVLLFWQSYYFLKRYDQFSRFALPMSSGMLSDHAKDSFKRMISKAQDEYVCDTPTKEWGELFMSTIRNVRRND